jgi:GYF domain 2
MADSWTISVGGRAYGPYTLVQMQSFHAEGRLADHSLVARAGEEQLRPAREDTELASLFAVQPAAAAAPAPASGEPLKFGRNQATADFGEPSHFVIISEMKARPIAALEEEIFSLGQAQRFMPQAWILVSDQSINQVRSALAQKLGKIDTLFIVDAAHDKACWFNFGPQNDARARALWQRPCDTAAKKAS